VRLRLGGRNSRVAFSKPTPFSATRSASGRGQRLGRVKGCRFCTAGILSRPRRDLRGTLPLVWISAGLGRKRKSTAPVFQKPEAYRDIAELPFLCGGGIERTRCGPVWILKPDRTNAPACAFLAGLSGFFSGIRFDARLRRAYSTREKGGRTFARADAQVRRGLCRHRARRFPLGRHQANVR
jgi:hypothetical protein